jgi:RHS repeat-associated protein
MIAATQSVKLGWFGRCTFAVLKSLRLGLGGTLAGFLLAIALAVSPVSITPAAAQNGGWCTALMGGGGCYGDPMAACDAQWGSYAPSETFLGYSDSAYWNSKNCQWTTHLGTILPATTWFQCNSGYTARPPGVCMKNNANFQLRQPPPPPPSPPPIPCNCDSANNSASPMPRTKNPIDLLTGSKVFRVTDFSTADGSLKLERFYASIEYGGVTWIMSKTPDAIAGSWRFWFQRELDLTYSYGAWSRYAEIETADGGSFGFSYSNTWSVMQPYLPDYGTVQTDYTLSFVGSWPSNLDTVITSSTQWTVHDPDDSVWLFQTYLDPRSGNYDIGHPVSVTFRGGMTWTFTYGTYNELTSVTDSYGKTVTFTWSYWDPSTLGLSQPITPVAIVSAALPDGTSIVYNSQSLETTLASSHPRADILTSVQHLDASSTVTDSTTYLYENTSFPTFITGIKDNAGTRRWTVAYDSDGRATTSEEPSGINDTTVAYTDPGYPSFTRTVTNALGKQTVYTYAWSWGDVHLLSVDTNASTNTPATTKTYSYSSSFVSSVTDEESRVTTYSRNGMGQPTQIVDGSGTSSARTTNITWDSNFRVPDEIAQPNLTTDFTWNSSGQLTQVKQTDTTSTSSPYSTNGQTRIWAYTYDSAGHVLTVDGPLSGTGDTVTYTYDSSGYLSTITNELGQVLTVSSVNGRGQPTVVVDENGVTTDLAYDSEGRLTTITVNPGTGQAVTSLTYDVVGDITQITRPNGAYLQYTWDNGRRLTKVQDNLGNSIQYTLDNLGGVTAVSIKDPSSTLQLSQTATYDELGRLLTAVGSASQTWTAAYDKTNNLVSVTDPRSNVFGQTFDALSRLIRQTDEDSNQVNLTLNGKDEITTYSDPRSLNTSYVRNGFGDVIQRTSPDSGTTVYTYNALGKPTQITDGRSVVTNLTYDNAGRLLTKQYPAATGENITISWDSTTGGNYGIGRITEIDDASGSIKYTYNVLGQVSQEKKTTSGVVYTIGYTYDLDGKVTQITYPSGRIVNYSRDSDGRISGATTKQSSSSSAVTLASSVVYEPFGPLSGLTYGNGLVLSKTFTEDYLADTIAAQDTSTSTVVVNRSYTFGDSINVTGITDSLTSARSEAYTYTASNRLQEGDGIWGTLTWTYDGVGNRASEALTSGSTTTNTYNYPSGSNLLASLTQSSTTVRSFSYDGAGNVTADTRGSTTYNYAYNKRNRLAELTIGSTVTANYTYDGLERLAIRTTSNMTPAGTTQYVYDHAGHLIAEADSSGNTLTEYVWLDDLPLAVVANVDTSPVLYFVHADHLNRPIRMTDGSESVVWDAIYNPFGDVNSITGSASNNLRFPGQFFLIEDGLHYNWYRHYDPTLGRYIQPDPLSDVRATQMAMANINGFAAGAADFPTKRSDVVSLPTNGSTDIGAKLPEFTNGPSIYRYVLDNPLKYTDPLGLAVTDGPPAANDNIPACRLAYAKCIAWARFLPQSDYITARTACQEAFDDCQRWENRIPNPNYGTTVTFPNGCMVWFRKGAPPIFIPAGGL